MIINSRMFCMFHLVKDVRAYYLNLNAANKIIYMFLHPANVKRYFWRYSSFRPFVSIYSGPYLCYLIINVLWHTAM